MEPLELQRLFVSKDDTMHSGLKIITLGVMELFLVACGGPSILPWDITRSLISLKGEPSFWKE